MLAKKANMVSIVGLVILALGFVLPFLIIPPRTCIYFFWLGGLLSFNKGLIFYTESRLPRWAQIGILANIALKVIANVTFLLTLEKSISIFVYRLETMLWWLSSPADALGQRLFPLTITHQPDSWGYGFQISYYRIVLTNFLDVAIFASLSVLIGLYWKKRKPGKNIQNVTSQ